MLTGAEDEGLMGYLMRFSITGTVSWPLFRDLWGGPGSRRLLDDLEATGLVVRSEGPGKRFSALPARARRALRDHFTSARPGEAERPIANWPRGSPPMTAPATSARRSTTP